MVLRRNGDNIPLEPVKNHAKWHIGDQHDARHAISGPEKGMCAPVLPRKLLSAVEVQGRLLHVTYADRIGTLSALRKTPKRYTAIGTEPTTRPLRELTMLNAQEVRGQWDKLRGKIKQKWGQLTDDDLQIIGGNVDELVGRIHEKTGVAREQVEQFIGDLASGTSESVERTRDAAMNYASQAASRVREGYEQMSDRMRDGYEQMSGQMRDSYERVGERVREHPGQAMLAIFGMGVITGVVLGLMLRSD